MTIEPTQVVLFILSILSGIIAFAAFFRNSKKDAQDLAAEISTLKNKVQNVQDVVNAAGVVELSAMKQAIVDLKARVEKIDNDVERKIDQMGAKIDNVMTKLNEVLIELTKHNSK